jgi:hypothetical protein
MQTQITNRRGAEIPAELGKNVQRRRRRRRRMRGRKERRDGGSAAGNRGEEKIAYFVALFVRS